MPLPTPSITTVPTEGNPDFPSLDPIQVIDSVGPGAANRQPNSLRTRDATLRDRINTLIANMNFIATGGAGATDYYLPRDGSLAMTGALDMGTTNKIVNLANPTAPQDAATKNYVDTAFTPGIQKQFPNSVGVQVSATGSGLQLNTGILNRPVTYVGNQQLPLYVRIMWYGFTTDSYGTFSDSTLVEVWPQLDSGTLKWYSRMRRVREGTLPIGWQYGTDGAGGITLPDNFWTRTNANTPDLEGVYYHLTAGTPLITPSNDIIARVNKVGNVNAERTIAFSWNNTTAQITIEIGGDTRNCIVDAMGVWDYLDATPTP